MDVILYRIRENMPLNYQFSYPFHATHFPRVRITLRNISSTSPPRAQFNDGKTEYRTHTRPIISNWIFMRQKTRFARGTPWKSKCKWKYTRSRRLESMSTYCRKNVLCCSCAEKGPLSFGVTDRPAFSDAKANPECRHYIAFVHHYAGDHRAWCTGVRILVFGKSRCSTNE